MRVVRQEYQKELLNYKNQKITVMIVKNHFADKRPYYSLDLYITKKKWYSKITNYIQIPLYISEDFNEIEKRFADLATFKKQ